jgi:uncharacterized membrane protein
MNAEPQQLSMNSQRLESLGDSIFAVAMTILAIELKVPAIRGAGWKDFVAALHESFNGLLCYAISFIVLGIMWLGHRLMFEYVGRTNRYFIFLGILFYLVVCLVPFSTRILAANTLRWYAILTYGANLSLCNLTLYAQWRYGLQRHSLLHRDVPKEVKKEANLLILLSPIVYLVAIIFSFFLPKVSIAIFVITPIVYLLPSRLDKYLP